MIGDSPFTSTVSAIPPTSIVSVPTSTRVPALTTMFGRRMVLKPLIVTSTLYVSAVTFGTTKSPSVLVTTGGDLVPRVSLMSVTVAPGITPPWPSLTVPATVAVIVCAGAIAGIANTATATATNAVNVLQKRMLETPPKRTLRGRRSNASAFRQAKDVAFSPAPATLWGEYPTNLSQAWPPRVQPGRLARLVVGAGVAAALCVPTAATGPQQPQQPTFRATVDLVAVDVQVVDPDGRPIPNLGAEKFEVSIDGKRRRVVSADFIRQDRADLASLSPTPSNSGSLAGRVFMLAVDVNSFTIGESRGVVTAARSFVQRLNPD